MIDYGEWGDRANELTDPEHARVMREARARAGAIKRETDAAQLQLYIEEFMRAWVGAEGRRRARERVR